MRQLYSPGLKSLFAVLLLIVTTNCTRDDFSDIQQITEENPVAKLPFRVDYLSADQAPVFVKEMFPSRNTVSNVTSTNSYIDTETGAVFDEQTIMKVTDTLGNTNYTIRFGFPHTPKRIFYNLIAGRDAQGVMNEPYIVRYVSDSTAFAAFKDSNYNFSKFRGKITYHKYADFFGTDKSLIGDLVVANRANRRGQATIDAQTSCPTEFDEFGDPVACETLTLDGGTSGSTGGSSGSGEGLPSGGTAGDDAGVDPSPPPGDGSTSDGSDGTREPEDPIDPVGGDTCCDVGGGATLGGGTYVPLDGGTGGSDGGGSGAGCLRWVGVEIICDAVGENCVAKSIYVPAECTVGTQTTNTFEECPECPTPTDGGAGILIPKVLGGGGTEETTSDDEQIILDESFLTNECLSRVYNKIGNSNTFNNYLKNFDGDMTVANLTFSVGVDITYPNANAVTYEPKNFMINIMFNPNNLNRPALDIARTFIHELIHAEMYRKLLSLSGQGKIPWTADFIKSLRNDFPGLYDYYTRFFFNRPDGIPIGDPQHEMMAQHYREIIINALKEFDPNQTNDLYEALSWSGLMGSGPIDLSTGLPPKPTLAWASIPQFERIQILKKTISYLNTNKSCL